jgi:hypothetical protein
MRPSGAKARHLFCCVCGTTKLAAEKLGISGDRAEYLPPRLKPTLILRVFAGVETPASLRIEFFRSLYKRLISPETFISDFQIFTGLKQAEKPYMAFAY